MKNMKVLQTNFLINKYRYIHSGIGIFFIVFILLALTNAASATTYYVRTDGNNVNAGTTNTSGGAWNTITYGLAHITAGDTLRVQKGTYTESGLSIPSGNSNNWTTLKGDNHPIISGGTNSFSHTSNSYIIIDGFIIQGYSNAGYYRESGVYSNVLIINNTFNGGHYSVYIGAIDSGKNTTIKNNEMYGQTGGTLVGSIDVGSGDAVNFVNNIIDGNYIHDLSNTNGIQFNGINTTIKNNVINNILYGITGGNINDNGNHILNNTISGCTRGIRFDYGNHNSEIAYNHVSCGGQGQGLDLYPWTGAVKPTPYQYWIHDNIMDNAGMGLFDNSVDIIENNTFLGSDGGIFFDAGMSESMEGNHIIRNNTFNTTAIQLYTKKGNFTITKNVFYNLEYDFNQCGFICLIYGGATSKLNITNNVFYNTNGYNAIQSDSSAGAISLVSIKNNIFFNVASAIDDSGNKFVSPSISYNLVYQNSGSAWGGKTSSNTLTQDPLFTNPASADFHLKSQYGRWNGKAWVTDTVTSPAINAGDPTIDNSRSPWGGIIEMGAYGNTPEASKSTAGDLPFFDFFLSNSGSITVNKGNSGSNNITTNLISGISEPVTFSVTGLPTNSSSSLSGGNSCSPTCSKTLTISTSTSTPAGTYSITASATNGTITRTTGFNLVVKVLDTTPPAAITNLATSNPTSNSIALTWAASGDDGNTGTASQYDIRYSTSTITDANWASATQATGEPTPSVAGTSQSFVVTGLSPSTTYYFAIKIADEVPNWSPISNSPSKITGVASANTFYVRTDGNDNCNGLYNNAGTSGNCAWRTIKKAANTITSGQTVRVQTGTYNDAFSISNNGTSGNEIRIIGDGNPILESSVANDISGKSYINLTGFNIINNGDVGLYIYGSNHIYISNIIVSNSLNQGILMTGGVSYITISNSTVHDNGWNEVQVYGDPDQVPGINHHVTIQNTEIYNCGHSCLDVHTMANNISIINNNIHGDSGAGAGGIYVHNGYVAGRYHNYINVSGNTVSNNYWGILMEQANNSVISNNILHDNSRGIDADANFNTTINHNLIYNSQTEGISLWDSLGKSFNNTLESNTISGINGPGIYINENHFNTIKNNLIINNQGYGISAGSASIAKYNNVWGNSGSYTGGVSAGTGTISQDPLFASPTAGDYHLKSQYARYTPTGWIIDVVTSPSISAGDPTNDNSKSPWGGRIEMGAYGNTPESSKSATSPTPSFDYLLSISGSIMVNQGSSGSNLISANLISGTSESVTISLTGLPSSSSISLSGGNSCSPTCSKTLTVYTTPSTPVGTYQITVSATNGTLIRTNQFNLVVNSSLAAEDINMDGVVNATDLSIVQMHFGETTSSPFPRFDVNHDSIIDIYDIRLVSASIIV